MGSIFREKANLILRTDEASNSNIYDTNFTWNNIDFRLILGDQMFNKYDIFTLNLVSLAVAIPANTTTLYGALPDDRLVDINVSGLSLVKSGYSFTSNSVLQSSVITPYSFPSSLSANSLTHFNIDNNSLTFNKDGMTSISINYTRCNTNSIGTYAINNVLTTSPVTPVAFPQVSFYFKITGIPRDDAIIHPSVIF